jgi:hypothetical protein
MRPCARYCTLTELPFQLVPTNHVLYDIINRCIRFNRQSLCCDRPARRPLAERRLNPVTSMNPTMSVVSSSSSEATTVLPIRRQRKRTSEQTIPSKPISSLPTTLSPGAAVASSLSSTPVLTATVVSAIPIVASLTHANNQFQAHADTNNCIDAVDAEWPTPLPLLIQHHQIVSLSSSTGSFSPISPPPSPLRKKERRTLQNANIDDTDDSSTSSITVGSMELFKQVIVFEETRVVRKALLRVIPWLAEHMAAHYRRDHDGYKWLAQVFTAPARRLCPYCQSPSELCTVCRDAQPFTITPSSTSSSSSPSPSPSLALRDQSPTLPSSSSSLPIPSEDGIQINGTMISQRTFGDLFAARFLSSMWLPRGNSLAHIL